MTQKKSLSRAAVIISVLLAVQSCKVTPPEQYLNGIATNRLDTLRIPEAIVQKGDLIGISVYSDNAEASAPFNLQMTTSVTNMQSAGASGMANGGVTSAAMPGYIVDLGGNIQMHSIGMVHVEGHTRKELEAILRDKLSPFLKNPYVTIRFLNYKVTILGEVNHPGVVTAPGDRMNILEGLGLAGDINLYGMKSDILVIRETNGRREYGQINLTDSNLARSPYFYLTQNDVVIVRTNPKRPGVSEQETTRRLSIVLAITTILTTMSVLYNIFK